MSHSGQSPGAALPGTTGHSKGATLWTASSIHHPSPRRQGSTVAGRSSLTLGAQKDPCGARGRAEVGKERKKGGRWPRHEWTHNTSCLPYTHTHAHPHPSRAVHKIQANILNAPSTLKLSAVTLPGRPGGATCRHRNLPPSPVTSLHDKKEPSCRSNPK